VTHESTRTLFYVFFELLHTFSRTLVLQASANA